MEGLFIQWKINTKGIIELLLVMSDIVITSIQSFMPIFQLKLYKIIIEQLIYNRINDHE